MKRSEKGYLLTERQENDKKQIIDGLQPGSWTAWATGLPRAAGLLGASWTAWAVRRPKQSSCTRDGHSLIVFQTVRISRFLSSIFASFESKIFDQNAHPAHRIFLSLIFSPFQVLGGTASSLQMYAQHRRALFAVHATAYHYFMFFILHSLIVFVFFWSEMMSSIHLLSV